MPKEEVNCTNNFENHLILKEKQNCHGFEVLYVIKISLFVMAFLAGSK